MNAIEIQFTTKMDPCPKDEQIQQWASVALRQQQKTGSITIRVTDEAEMTMLNHQYRKKNKPTNVLSFPSQIPPFLREDRLGDIVICASVVAKEANEQKKPLYAHWAHLIVHGILHLLGFDHENEEDAQKMEAAEVAILRELGYSDPYRIKEKNHE